MDNPLFILLAGIAIGFLIAAWFRRGRRTETQEKAESNKPSEEKKPSESLTEALYKLATELEDFLHQSAHPRDLMEQPKFKQGVALLKSSETTASALIDYGLGENISIACMAYEALSQREGEEDPTKEVLATLHRVYLWPIFFAFRALRPQPGRSVAGAALSRAASWWPENTVLQGLARELVRTRVAEGEVLTFDDRLEALSADELGRVEKLLEALGMDEVKPLTEELHAWQRVRVDTSALKAIGKVWGSGEDDDPIIEHPSLKRVVHEVATSLTGQPRKSVILIGETGVGKTTLYTVVARRLQRQGWTILEAGATDILAGQMYIGQLEERIQELTQNLMANRKVLWIIPNFHELLMAGAYRENPRGVLDMLMPHLEDGSITIVGETEPEAFERLIQRKPQLRAIIQGIQLYPLDNEETLALARAWNRASVERGASEPIAGEILEEALHLAQQFLDKAAAPGNLIDFLKLAMRSEIESERPMELDDLLRSLTQLTGLPSSILDARQGLDLDGLRSLFQHRVLGQPEAVDCLVERVAMIKAGLNDPSRPAGVFLFVGPTGTGKTEIAKTLAEFLFGSADRMIRFDMSEFQTEESLDRLLGEGSGQSESKALVNLIRKQPFSVILLDEFEKANLHIWDLFLQVFDDGRLTDRLGNTADFRHSIIIMTSNLGAAIPRGSQVGFSGEKKVFSELIVTRSVEQTFRPEFLNRIDRIVVFRPLSRSVVRDILLKELSDVLQRRGLRNREWAVEWEESALDFLLEKGFTAELGARPLKRAIERYLLSPLSITIVKNQFPEGDQFLFVRSKGNALDVEFIDPDATDSEGGAMTSHSDVDPEAIDASLKPLILDPVGAAGEVEQLQSIYGLLTDEVHGEAWQDRKSASLSMTSSPEFWESEDRYEVLGEIEYMDRLERALETAESLFSRLCGEDLEARTTFSPVLIQRLAHRLYLLENAIEGDDEGLPRDAFIAIEPGQSDRRDDAVQVFAAQLAEMYKKWAAKRQMRHKILVDQRLDTDRLQRFVMAVAGLGAYPILSMETGLHVWEEPGDNKGFHRSRVRVQVAPQPVLAGDTTEVLLKQAEEAFAGLPALRQIVRRYRKDPSPLVRDSAAGWRTGKLDLVLEGDFDLIG